MMLPVFVHVAQMPLTNPRVPRLVQFPMVQTSEGKSTDYIMPSSTHVGTMYQKACSNDWLKAPPIYAIKQNRTACKVSEIDKTSLLSNLSPKEPVKNYANEYD